MQLFGYKKSLICYRGQDALNCHIQTTFLKYLLRLLTHFIYPKTFLKMSKFLPVFYVVSTFLIVSCVQDEWNENQNNMDPMYQYNLVYEEKDQELVEYGILSYGTEFVRLNEDQTELMNHKFESGEFLRTQISQQDLKEQFDIDLMMPEEEINKSLVATRNGSKKLLAIKIDMPGSQVSCSKQDIEDKFFGNNGNSINSYFSDQSNGALSFNGEVIEISLEQDLNYITTIFQAIEPIVNSMGYSFSDYDYISILTQNVAWYVGIAFVNGKFSHIDLCDHPQVFEHEIGHNLGLLHAARINENGSISEYGDCSSVMGCQHIAFNAGNLESMGWLPNGKIRKVNGPNATINIFPLKSSGNGGKEMILLQKTNSIFETIVSSRTSTTNYNQNLGTNFESGLSIHRRIKGSKKTYLLTTLSVGESYFDSTQNKTIEFQGSNNNGSLKVVISS